MQSSEIDCFSWVNQSGRFDEQKISTDLQIITQAYFRDGFIEVEISEPKVVFIISPEFTTVEVSFDVKEGKQYFMNNIDVRSLDEDRDFAFIAFLKSDFYCREFWRDNKSQLWVQISLLQ